MVVPGQVDAQLRRPLLGVGKAVVLLGVAEPDVVVPERVEPSAVELVAAEVAERGADEALGLNGRTGQYM